MSVVLWDSYTRKIVNSDGSIRVDRLQLSYDQYDTIEFQWKSSISGTLVSVDVSSAVSWSASINVEYNDSATVMARTLNANIDHTDADHGIVLIPIDSKTSTWLSQLGASGVKAAKFEVIGRDSMSQGIFKAILDINAENAIDPAGGTPPAPTSNFYTKSEVDAMIAIYHTPYSLDFAYSSLTAGILSITHGKSSLNPVVTVKDSNGAQINPPVSVTGSNTLTVDMSAWGVFAGTYNVMVRK